MQECRKIVGDVLSGNCSTFSLLVESEQEQKMDGQFGAYDPVAKEEILRRISELKVLMAESGVDYGLIIENVDRFYFTGTLQKGILVVPVDCEPYFFLEKSIERGRRESPLDIIPIKRDKEIPDLLRLKGFLHGTVGLELDVLPVAAFERLQSIFGFKRHIDISPLIKTLRTVKSPFELDQMKKAGQMMAPVFEAARQVVQEGTREIDIDATLVGIGRRLGHQGILRMRGLNQELGSMTVQSGYTGAIATCADSPIAGAGVSPAVPLGSSLKKVERGVPVTIDYGGTYNGYVTDETRAYVVGSLQERFQRPYACTLEILEDVMAYAKEGVDCTEIFARVYKIVERAGLQDYFMGYGEGQVSFIGHGIGLEINELPVITARHRTVLKVGMVFALEPKFVFPDQGAIGVELDFIVQQDRLERVTADPFELVKL